MTVVERTCGRCGIRHTILLSGGRMLCLNCRMRCASGTRVRASEVAASSVHLGSNPQNVLSPALG
jgi:hypothetical protein